MMMCIVLSDLWVLLGFIRFIISEIVTAIQEVHEQGFCYNDLKPENILITELGHVKVINNII